MLKQKLKYLLIIFAILIASISTVSFGIDVIPEKSEAHKEWEELSKEEKKETIEPFFVDFNLGNSVKKSELNNLLAGNESLDSKFDLRTVLQNNINVKNQKHTGSCWAFSYSSTLETTMANKNKKTGINYSPMHMDYITSQVFNRKVGTGGNYHLATAYSASGYGPIYESDLPFESVYDETNNSQSSYFLSDISNINLVKTARARVKDVTYFPNIYKTLDTSTGKIIYKNSPDPTNPNVKTYSDSELTAIRNLIKKHIKQNGAVSTMIFMDTSGNATSVADYNSEYYNKENKAYYNPSNTTENHGVTIVGWDDDFKKENFAENHRPVNDGAYIVLNSWGEEFGDDGYFYVSYDDNIIERFACGVKDIEEISEKNYDKLYEYDELGMSIHLYAINDEATKYLNSAYLANVFKRDTSNNKYEYLSEIGVFLSTAEGVEVYVNPNGDDLTKGELVATFTGDNALETGYHTLQLSSPVLLTGEKFAVKVKYINSELTTLPVECNIKESGISNATDNYDTAKSNVGESFLSTDGNTWKDLSGYNYGGVYTLKDTNACIKAFSTYSDTLKTVAVTKIELNEDKISIQEGETANLVATIYPTNATNKNVTWTSSDESVATVSENGIINAKKEGKTTITVTTEDGKYTATCQVTITKKKSTDNDIYKEENNTSKGNTSNVNNSNKNINNSSSKEIKTSSKQLATPRELPYTGAKISILICIGLAMCSAITIYIKSKKYKKI